MTLPNGDAAPSGTRAQPTASASPDSSTYATPASRAPEASARTPAPTRPSRAARSQPWLATPAPVRRLFARFPLQTLPANALPASRHEGSSLSSNEKASPLSSSEKGSPYQQRSSDEKASRSQHHSNDKASPSSEDDLPILHLFTTPAGARAGLPSYNPACLQHQTWLRVHGVRVRVVPSSNHAAPGGSLPFVVLPRRERRSTESGGSGERENSNDGISGEKRRDGTITEKLGEALGTKRGGDPAANNDAPIPAAKLWSWAADHGAKGTDDISPLQRARETAYLALVEHRLKAAWLLALYLTPANFAALGQPLYIDATTSSGVVRARLAGELKHAARQALHALSPPTASARLSTGVLPSLLHSWVSSFPSSTSTSASSDPSTPPSSSSPHFIPHPFPTPEDADQIYAAAARALESLATQLGSDTWFFGRSAPGQLDVAVFSYVHLMRDARLRERWVDRRWAGLLKGRWNGLEALEGHWERMGDAYWGDVDL